MPSIPVLKASFAGSCYPSSPQDILDHFQKALISAPRPRIPALKSSAYIVPHIDFRVNLDIYAEVYRMISERRSFPELFVILGVGHHCPHEFSACPFIFDTPLGKVESRAGLVHEIQQDCPFPISLSPATFRREHSLEFVVIWLQALRDLYFPGRSFSVLPVLLGGLHEHLEFGHPPAPDTAFYRFGQALKKHLKGHDIVMMASIDGCHVGPRFEHDFPADAKVQKIVRKWEKQLWSSCRPDRLDAFFRQAAEIGNAFCFDGLGVLMLLLQHFDLKATIASQDLWYEKSDRSFVTFSGGWFDKTRPIGAQ